MKSDGRRPLSSQKHPQSSQSFVRLSYQTVGQRKEDFIDISSRSATPVPAYGAEIFYNGGLKIWSIIGNHRLTISYSSEHVTLESLRRRNAGGDWVAWNSGYSLKTPAIEDPDAQLVLRISKRGTPTTLSRENDARQHNLINESAFPLAQYYQTFTRIKLHLIGATRDRNWRPQLLVSCIERQKLDRTRQNINPHLCDMADIADALAGLDPRLKAFLDLEEAAIKAERVSAAIAGALETFRITFPSDIPDDTRRLPILSILMGGMQSMKDIVPLAEREHLVDFSRFDDINPSQQRAVQNVFDHQVSLVHAPPSCGQNATIVIATEAILLKSPRSRVLICSTSNAAADTIAEDFTTREHLCSFRFGHMRYVPQSDEDSRNIKVMICTYAEASGVERLPKSWMPQVLIADNASLLRHYQIIVPLSAYSDSLNKMILVGDHIRRGPLATTEAGRIAWNVSIFERMMEERWPKQILDVNYKTDSELWYPTNLVCYQYKVKAIRNTAEPGPFLCGLLSVINAGLHIRDDEGNVAKISTFAHFIDMCNTKDDSTEPEFTVPKFS